MQKTNVVFDIGGTSMRVAAVSENGPGEIRKVPTPQRPEEGVSALARLIRECAAGGELGAVAGGFPGVIADGMIHFAPNLPAWKGIVLSAELSQLLEAPVEVRHQDDQALHVVTPSMT